MWNESEGRREGVYIGLVPDDLSLGQTSFFAIDPAPLKIVVVHASFRVDRSMLSEKKARNFSLTTTVLTLHHCGSCLRKDVSGADSNCITEF